MVSFSRKGSSIRLKLRSYERELLEGLLGEMRLLLEADLPRVDPVTARLFPDAYETAEEQEDYQEMVGDQLRRDKLRALESVEACVEGEGDLELKLTDEDANTWLTVLNDLRLAIGTRLDVTEERMEERVDENDPDAPGLSALHWLGWVQESILREVHL